MNIEEEPKKNQDPDTVSIVSISGQNSVMQESFTQLDSISDDASAPLIMDANLKATTLVEALGDADDNEVEVDDLVELRTQATSASFVSIHGADGGRATPDMSDDDNEFGSGDAPPISAPPSDYVIIYPDGRQTPPPDWGLERALEGGARCILIYADPLGEHTARWIRLGNFLHKSAALCSLTSLPCAGVALHKLNLYANLKTRPPSGSSAWPNILTLQPVSPNILSSSVTRSALRCAKVATYLAGLLVGAGTLCTLLYMSSWQFDPCSKYQVLTASALSKGLLDETKFPPSHPIRRLLANAHSLPSAIPPVVLIYKDDRARKFFHCSMTSLAAALTLVAAYRLYRA